MKKNQARQGDVFIERVENDIPKGKLIHGKTVAHGEVTGHHHTFADAELEECPQEVKLPGDLGDALPMTRIIGRLGKPSELRHQEHAPIPQQRGTVRITRQREYSPAAIRNVAD